MRLFPAIDLRGGRVVRLTQGDYDRMTVYGDDPVAVAEGFVAAGAEYLHTVDLDAAKSGGAENRAVIGRLCGLPLFVQTGGGIRTEADIEAVLALGVKRAILGTVAVTDFDFTARMGKKYGERLAVGVDARDGLVAIHGWQTVTDIGSFDFCQRLVDVGITTVIYTDIGKDGLLAGANLAAYERLNAIHGLRVIASGGVTGEGEIARLRDMGVYGAIVGKALYAGKLDLKRALQVAKGEAEPC
jgi:phosphoribosylformimino-5-aminoimidazole carboxamide ribotide isomerase